MRRLTTLIALIILLLPSRVGAVSLLPAVTEISGSKGSVLTQTITVLNTKNVDQTYFLKTMKFIASDDGASPVFISNQEDHSGLPDWIVLPFTEFQVPAHGKKEIEYTIVIPADVSSGGYYGALMVSQTPSELVESNRAVVDAVTAALVLLTVEGDTVEQASLLDFTDHGPLVRSVLSQTFSYRLQNQGNVHLTPFGTLTIKDLFGRTVSSLDANALKSRVLPTTTRVFDVKSEDQPSDFISTINHQIRSFALGPMHAELQLSYGVNQQIIQAQTTFWYVPWQLLSLLIGVVLVLVFIVRSKKKRPLTHRD